MFCTRATRGSLIWFAPAVPVSCRYVSTNWYTPIAPTGWPRAFKPPIVEIGSVPSRAISPCLLRQDVGHHIPDDQHTDIGRINASMIMERQRFYTAIVSTVA